jgi:hypothetical protein
MDLWIEFYFALSEKWAVGVMGCRSNGMSELWAVGIMLRIRERMVGGFTTTYAFCAYHHWCCEFEYCSGRGVQHCVIVSHENGMKTDIMELADANFHCLVLWCLTPLSTIFQLYRGGQFYWLRKRSTQRKPPTCHKSLTNFITQCCTPRPEQYSNSQHQWW